MTTFLKLRKQTKNNEKESHLLKMRFWGVNIPILNRYISFTTYPKTKKCLGVSSRIQPFNQHWKHALLIDIDEWDPQDAVPQLSELMAEFNLPLLHIITTRHGFHCYCPIRLTFKRMFAILAHCWMQDLADEKFVKYTNIRRQATLRVSGEDLEYWGTLESKPCDMLTTGHTLFLTQQFAVPIPDAAKWDESKIVTPHYYYIPA